MFDNRVNFTENRKPHVWLWRHLTEPREEAWIVAKEATLRRYKGLKYFEKEWNSFKKKIRDQSREWEGRLLRLRFFRKYADWNIIVEREGGLLLLMGRINIISTNIIISTNNIISTNILYLIMLRYCFLHLWKSGILTKTSHGWSVKIQTDLMPK